jgi:hypothetical protein
VSIGTRTDVVMATTRFLMFSMIMFVTTTRFLMIGMIVVMSATMRMGGMI